jgi:hypothetical protein
VPSRIASLARDDVEKRLLLIEGKTAVGLSTIWIELLCNFGADNSPEFEK